MENFDYIEPTTLKAAVGLLARHKGRARLLAGGTDLLVEMKGRFVRPKCLINLKKIREMDRILFDKKKGLFIGSLATWTSIIASRPIDRHYPVLREAASLIGCPQIRNMGTIGGNICHASPSADSAPALMVYGAQCVIAGPRRQRVIPIEKIFEGVQKISLGPEEILAGFRIPPPDPRSKGCYLKFSPRKAMDLPIVGVGVLIQTSNGIFQDARIALGAAAPTPLRAGRAERFLLGKPINDETMHKERMRKAREG